MTERVFVDTVRGSDEIDPLPLSDDELVDAGHAACDQMDTDVDSLSVLETVRGGQLALPEAGVIMGYAAAILCPEHLDYLERHPLR